MKVNFEIDACKEILHDYVFGLCDDGDGTKAYANTDNISKWIATVKNQKLQTVTFTAVDKCILNDHEFPGLGRCDGILTTDDQIYFVELKDQKRSRNKNAIHQLESTIMIYLENRTIDIYKHKKAFICNKRNKHFQIIDHEVNLKFFRKYKVRLDMQAEIIIL